MFPGHQQEIGAIAFQLLAALEEYEEGMDQLVHEAWDSTLYRSTTDCFDRMRNYAAAMPRLSVPWVELLIRRFELVASLWEKIAGGSAAAGGLAKLARQHDEALRRLRAQVRDHLPRNS